jgi:myo-inositol-1(or 4)-monophosphatase
MENLTSFITATLQDASAITSASFGTVTGSVKSADNNQVLTETDIQVGELIVSRIKATFPQHNIIDEEAGIIDNNSTYTWVVDPIDGTSNFASGLPMYGIMMGLLEKGTPIAGGIALPYFSQIYTAEKGKGAFCGDQKIHVSTEPKLLNSLVAYGIDGHQEDPQLTAIETGTLSRIVLGIRNLRSSNSAFDNIQVATGAYGGYLNKTSKIWDNAAPHIITEEAGKLHVLYRFAYTPRPAANNNPSGGIALCKPTSACCAA